MATFPARRIDCIPQRMKGKRPPCGKAKGKRQRAKGRCPAGFSRFVAKRPRPFAFCLLPFAFCLSFGPLSGGPWNRDLLLAVVTHEVMAAVGQKAIRPAAVRTDHVDTTLAHES